MRKKNKIAVLILCGALACATVSSARVSMHGFVENATGVRLRENPKTTQKYFSMGEQRVQVKTSFFPEGSEVLDDWNTELFFKGDMLMDEYKERLYFEPRELFASVSPSEFMDLKVGQQILTWGTGDYIFINDVFPKDYVSFFAGRDDEYLKKPSYAARATFFTDLASMDFVVIPYFTPNEFVKGDRFTFYDSFKGGIVGMESHRLILEPPFQAENTEIASRVYGNLDSYEWAGYFYKGFYKNPMGYKNEALEQLYFPELNVYGASLRGPAPVIGGIANIEIGYFDSLEDRPGKDRLKPNSGIKYLAGYKRAFKHDFEIGVQYYVDQMLYYDNYKSSLMPYDSRDDELYQQFTLRLTKLMASQTVRLSLFTFYSPTDGDVYMRPSIFWNATDSWSVAVGGNVFVGEQTNGDFGQYVEDSNVYFRVRYSY